ncbi:hypothetical protein [Olivibacter jilunii]|uniref:hypothetical protein n=1 Tax=Olivibacter jilunii TaxID=985016 RepID=UPI00102FEFEC|nr:hypothetical protein [Olivibacter jilunii]
MLQHISWQQFLLAATLLTFLWYIGVILLLYRKELKNFLTGKKSKTEERKPEESRKETESLPVQSEEDTLMGTPRLPEGLNLMEMDKLSFAPKKAQQKEKMLGALPDLLEEMKQLFQIVKDEEGTKADFLVLLDGFKPRLSEIRTEGNEQAIREFLLEHIPFELSKKELDSLWV